MQAINNKIISEATLKKRQTEETLSTIDSNNIDVLAVYEKLIDFLNSKINDWACGIDVSISNSIFVNIRDIEHEIPEIVKFRYLLKFARKALKEKQFNCYITSDGTFFIGAKNFLNSFLHFGDKNSPLIISMMLNVVLFLLINIINKPLPLIRF